MTPILRFVKLKHRGIRLLSQEHTVSAKAQALDPESKPHLGFGATQHTQA